MIFDTAYDPWRLIKVMVNENSGDDPIVHLSWTMDCQRVITITHSVCRCLICVCVWFRFWWGFFWGVVGVGNWGEVAKHANILIFDVCCTR